MMNQNKTNMKDYWKSEDRIGSIVESMRAIGKADLANHLEDESESSYSESTENILKDTELIDTGQYSIAGKMHIVRKTYLQRQEDWKFSDKSTQIGS